VNDILIKAIINTVNERITKQELLKILGINLDQVQKYITNLITEGSESRNQVDIEMSVVLGHIFQFPENIMDYYHELLLQDWHISHEDIISLIEFKKLPKSVPFIEAAIKLKSKLIYLEYDDYGSYYRKCFWALYMINTLDADHLIEKYTKDNDNIIAEAAKERLMDIINRKKTENSTN
jgi:hypothetical protein